ncbi:MAG: ABC transporter substrate-binding protein [Casimicrobiaceae bacterium]
MLLRVLQIGLLALAVVSLNPIAVAQELKWAEVLAKAKGQTVYWNAWAGDEKTNAFIAWAGDEVNKRYGVKVQHVRLKDTAEAVTRVVAEKAAGRNTEGTVDLIWINGPNFLAMKQQNLLFGPFTHVMPNWQFVDTVNKRSNVIDFTIPVEGLESPWRLAQIVFVYDSKRIKDVPKSVPDLLEWAKKNPGRLTHPSVRNFLGATFLKQALFELAPDSRVLQSAATDANFQTVTAALWAWYDQLRPNLWRQGTQFPENGPAQRQLLNDGEIDMMISFNPSEAAVSIAGGLLPDSVRTFVFAKGTIGNTSFVAIPYNAAHKEGAMVVANFLLDPATQAYAQDYRQMGNFTVLDLAKLSAADRRRFDELPKIAALPTNAELGTTLLEPHASWMTRITAEWERRYTK